MAAKHEELAVRPERSRGTAPRLAQIYLTEGFCYAALRDFDGVERVFRRALDFDPDLSLDPRQQDPVLAALLEKVRAKLHARLHVRDEVTGTPLRLDGQSLGTAPFDGAVPIGTHLLVRERADEGAVQQRLTFYPDTTVEAPSVPHAPRREPTERAQVVPKPQPLVQGEVEAQVTGDVRSGVGASVGAGAYFHYAYATLSGTFGGGVGMLLSLGGRFPELVGPVGIFASVDGALLFSGAATPGIGGTAGLSVTLPQHFELYAGASYRQLAASEAFRPTYVLVNGGVRWLFGS